MACFLPSKFSEDDQAELLQLLIEIHGSSDLGVHEPMMTSP
jgi:hypothetical protein